MQIHPTAVFNKVPLALRQEYCRSEIPLVADLQFIFREEQIFLSTTLNCPQAGHLSHFSQDDDEYAGKIDEVLRRGADQEQNLEQKPFKSLEKILDELHDIEKDVHRLRSDEYLAIAGLQPRSTGALEDFSRTVVLDALTRLVYKIEQPVKLLEAGGEDEAGNKMRTWMQEVLAKGDVWDGLAEQNKAANELKGCQDDLQKKEKKVQYLSKALERKKKVLEDGAGSAAEDSTARPMQETLDGAKGDRDEAERKVGEAEEKRHEHGKKVLAQMRATDGLTCPFCKDSFDPSTINRCCDVGDIHPEDADELLRWILVQCLCDLS